VALPAQGFFEAEAEMPETSSKITAINKKPLISNPAKK
jgi:hypothetical protein